MTERRALAIVALAGLAILALSFVGGWIAQDREIRGEGYRHSLIVLSAWRAAAVPVLSLAALAALLTTLLALLLILRPRTPIRWLVVVGAVSVLGLVGAAAVPLSWDGLTTSVDLRPGPLTAVGLLLAAVMVVAAAVAAGLGRRAVVPLVAGGLLLAGVAAGGRLALLIVTAPSNQAWQDGTYVRAADGLPPLTLTVSDGTFQIDDHWAGTWEGSDGWTVALDDDPACPGSRGAYHAHGEGDDGADLRFVKIVDTCGDGERAADLESGIWVRQP